MELANEKLPGNGRKTGSVNKLVVNNAIRAAFQKLKEVHLRWQDPEVSIKAKEVALSKLRIQWQSADDKFHSNIKSMNDQIEVLNARIRKEAQAKKKSRDDYDSQAAIEEETFNRRIKNEKAIDEVLTARLDEINLLLPASRSLTKGDDISDLELSIAIESNSTTAGTTSGADPTTASPGSVEEYSGLPQKRERDTTANEDLSATPTKASQKTKTSSTVPAPSNSRKAPRARGLKTSTRKIQYTPGASSSAFAKYTKGRGSDPRGRNYQAPPPDYDTAAEKFIAENPKHPRLRDKVFLSVYHGRKYTPEDQEKLEEVTKAFQPVRIQAEEVGLFVIFRDGGEDTAANCFWSLQNEDGLSGVIFHVFAKNYIELYTNSKA